MMSTEKEENEKGKNKEKKSVSCQNKNVADQVAFMFLSNMFSVSANVSLADIIHPNPHHSTLKIG